ncbi:DinB family protein [Mucilaginibacter gotjawali]|uniref:Damage-inducible protein DinB n=1 Tax=Mucilaginibacter gotjawali TaxID=1550579 RepID=A0A839S903_9SPHI|nr:DinB family protein [Mucilaginibacter gotjawali]MBB3054465.1 putative damage-inducible protein DinB [Mucilaginibacter gotjawali]
MINRPQPDEYSAFAARYVDLVGNGPIIEILEYLQQMTYNLFLRIDPDKAAYAYADGKWTVKQVVGHITDTERVFAYRALVFSREAIALPGFDQDVYMEKATFNSRSLEDLANEFNTVRESTLYLFKSFTEEQTLQKGIASGNPVSVRALAYMIAGHEMHHIKILKERYL